MTSSSNSDPHIVGWAHGKFGKSDAESVADLMAEVLEPALAHAEVEAEDVDGIFVGIFGNGFTPQMFEASLPGMAMSALAHVPSMRLENACATGSSALYAAADFIASGRGKIALVVGAEKMTGVPPADAGRIMLGASWVEEEAQNASSFADLFGRVAQNYFQKYGDRSEQLAMIAAKNHRNAMNNPYAHMQKDFGVEFCNTPSDKNPIVAAPLRRTDCSLISDGAAAIVLAAPEVAESLPRAIAFRARSQANDILAMSKRDATAFDGARRAWDTAYDQAGVTYGDLDLVETHDCFTIAELIEYEAMGLAEPGQGHRIIEEGVSAKDGALPINPSGGLKAKGHPLGATGVSQHIMAAMQLMDEADGMQVADAKLAGVFNMGGISIANYVSILERVK